MPSGDRRWREQGLRSAVLAGDETAWQTWYDETFPGLYAFVRWRCAGLNDWADDVVQETWLTAIRRIRAFDPDQSGTRCGTSCGSRTGLGRLAYGDCRADSGAR